MYPFFRLAKSVVQGALDTRIGFTNPSEMVFWTRPYDMDWLLELNNGRILTLCDVGRIHLAMRTGLGKQCFQRKWGFVIAGTSMRYQKRIRAFCRVRMQTQVVAVDEKWLYLQQNLFTKQEMACAVLSRIGVTALSTGKLIPIDTMLDTLGLSELDLPTPQWVRAWIDADKLRPIAE